MRANASSAARSRPPGSQPRWRVGAPALTPEGAFAALHGRSHRSRSRRSLQLRSRARYGREPHQLSASPTRCGIDSKAYASSTRSSPGCAHVRVQRCERRRRSWESVSTIRSSASGEREAGVMPRDAADWHTASRAKPRRCARHDLSNGRPREAATGWSATPRQYAGPFHFVPPERVAGRDQPANGPMPATRPSTATCSTSSERAAAISTFHMSPTRHNAS